MTELKVGDFVLIDKSRPSNLHASAMLNDKLGPPPWQIKKISGAGTYLFFGTRPDGFYRHRFLPNRLSPNERNRKLLKQRRERKEL
jgi:hypothetical protein